jgi:UDP-2-acetamido-3-amino-2,3-dideoxy-glucuronate N-acetyltransferase
MITDKKGSLQTPRVALVGCGYWGANLARNFDNLNALAAICESDESKRSALSKQYPRSLILGSFTDVLQDDSIDAIAVSTPAASHADLVREGLLAGKDVFVEKPLCLSVATGRALVELARERERILMVGHLLWYHPAIRKLKQLIDAGELGRIQYIYSNRLNLGKFRQEENILWSFAPHDISVILGLVGEMPDGVEAQGGNYLHDKIADVTVNLLTFPSGVKAHIFVSWLHPFKEQKLVVVGDRKMAVFDDIQKQDKLLVYPHSVTWKNHFPVPNKADAEPVSLEDSEPLRNECAHFLDCVSNRRKPETDGEEGLRVLDVLQQSQEMLERKMQQRKSATSQKPKRSYFAHESAFIDENTEIGPGTSIWHVSHVLQGSRIGNNCKIGQNVVIGPRAIIGNGVKIQNNVSVYEGVTLEDHVFCGPSMVFTNVFNPRSEIARMDEVRLTVVRKGASLGANCTIVCGVTVGQYAFVGAGTVVLKSVPDFALIVGNPGRIAGWMCTCGNRIEFESAGTGTCRACERTYEKVGDSVTPQ